jgi:hypothetical protein
MKWLATGKNILLLWGADASRRYMVEALNLHDEGVVLQVWRDIEGNH